MLISGCHFCVLGHTVRVYLLPLHHFYKVAHFVFRECTIRVSFFFIEFRVSFFFPFLNILRFEGFIFFFFVCLLVLKRTFRPIL